MKKAVLVQTDPLFLEQCTAAPVRLGKEDYLLRLSLLRGRMKNEGIDFALLYGDREHFANIDYFTGYDCRFEESLFIIPLDGTPALLVGNEGMAYSYVIPYEVQRVYYRNFSLQGQPREAGESLAAILRKAGIDKSARVGLCGYKYFLKEYIATDPLYTFDLPQYVMQEICSAAEPKNVINYTEMLTGLADGIRLRVHTARDIAVAEAAACRAAAVLLRMLERLRPGMTEYELSERSHAGFAPWSMFPLINFGPKRVQIGISSPTQEQRLSLGDPCALCYGIRGCLNSRVAVAAYDEASMGGLRGQLYSFYGKFFEAMCAWYETLRVGASGHGMHWAIHNIIGGGEFGVTLNAGHYTGMDEWVNSLCYDGSQFTLPDGAYLQADIIASAGDPVRTAICEDGVIVAGGALRGALQKEYPETYARIMARAQKMREVIGVNLSEDVLPLSNLNGVMFPFMLNLNTMFGLRDA